MLSRIRTSCAWALALALSTGSASALAQTTITGNAGGGDSWNDAANWSAGVPSGALDAIVFDGVWAQVNNAATPVYSGTLTLNAGARLTMACSGGGCGGGTVNAVANAAGVTLFAGAEIQVNVNTDIAFPPITLLGDAKLSSLFGASDWQTDDFSAINGPYTLTLEHFNGHTVNLNGANSFSELILDTVDRWTLTANAAGCLGTGNVTVNPRADGRSASLVINVPDALDDGATLTLNGNPGQGGFTGDGSDYVIMNANDTLAGLVVYGVQLPNGTYTNAEPWLSGPGSLTVAATTIGQTYCSPAVANSTGSPARILASGSDLAADDDLTLLALDLPPNQFGYFIGGQVSGFTPNAGGSQGHLCVGLPTARLLASLQSSGVGGTLTYQVDTDSIPLPPNFNVAISAGETWYWQAWYRDVNPTTTSNFTDGVAIPFL